MGGGRDGGACGGSRRRRLAADGCDALAQRGGCAPRLSAARRGAPQRAAGGPTRTWPGRGVADPAVRAHHSSLFEGSHLAA